MRARRRRRMVRSLGGSFRLAGVQFLDSSGSRLLLLFHLRFLLLLLRSLLLPSSAAFSPRHFASSRTLPPSGGPTAPSNLSQRSPAAAQRAL
ncbi:hypothetical protein BDV98DRAFT_570053, partial [Pterulicium gracile]